MCNCNLTNSTKSQEANHNETVKNNKIIEIATNQIEETSSIDWHDP